MMKIVFVGASRFGLRCLDGIIDMSDIDIVGVITNEQKFSISYAPEGVSNVLYADFSKYAQEKGIPAYLMKEKMTEPELVDQVRDWDPDLLLVIGWYHMVPGVLRSIAPAAGLHASLLPDYSGGAPLVWAIINGEKKTGITFFQFSDGVDNGPIIAQGETDILPGDTIATLYARIEVLGLSLLRDSIPCLASGTALLIDQDESKRRIFPQRKPEDGRINWAQPAARLYDFIRAQTHPYPGAFCFFQDEKLTVWSSSDAGLYDGLERPCGSFFMREGKVYAVCGGHSLLALGRVEINGEECSAMDWFGEVAASSGMLQ